MFIIDDLLLAFIGWLIPLKKSTPTLLMRHMELCGFTPALTAPMAFYDELSAPIIADAERAVARYKGHPDVAGNRSLHHWVEVGVEAQAMDIVRVWLGHGPASMDLIEPGFEHRIRITLADHQIPPPT